MFMLCRSSARNPARSSGSINECSRLPQKSSSRQSADRSLFSTDPTLSDFSPHSSTPATPSARIDENRSTSGRFVNRVSLQTVSFMAHQLKNQTLGIQVPGLEE